MVKSDLENEQKIKKWAKSNPKFRRFLDNMPLLKRLYANHHKPTKVVDCMEDQDAKLELIVVKSIGKTKVKLCSKCNRKPGEKETEECGESDFVEMEGRTFSAGDETGEILITIPPWYDGEKELEANEMYTVEGNIRMYKEKLQIQPTKIHTIIEDTTDAETAFKEMMELNDGEVSEEEMADGMQGYEPYIESVMQKLGYELQDGIISKKSDE